MPRVLIRLLKTLDELRECERLQVTVWGTLAASSELLTVTQKYGGVVLGAWVDGRIVGFLYAFLARRRGRLIHWSHMMAVESEFRDRGLGLRMKLAHRRLALEQGIKSICWTYDPLQSRNATLNLNRLGGRVEEYVADCYGQFPSRIEKRLPSDRFVVEWEIDSAEVERRLSKGPRAAPSTSLLRVNETRLNARRFLANGRISLIRREPRLLVEIPANTEVMRAQALALARRWRFETRKIFERYLSAGYRVGGFIPPGAATQGRCFYVLARSRGAG